MAYVEREQIICFTPWLISYIVGDIGWVYYIFFILFNIPMRYKWYYALEAFEKQSLHFETNIEYVLIYIINNGVYCHALKYAAPTYLAVLSCVSCYTSTSVRIDSINTCCSIRPVYAQCDIPHSFGWSFPTKCFPVN